MDLKFKFQIETTGKKLKWDHPSLYVLYLFVNILLQDETTEKKLRWGHLLYYTCLLITDE